MRGLRECAHKEAGVGDRSVRIRMVFRALLQEAWLLRRRINHCNIKFVIKDMSRGIDHSSFENKE